MEQENLWRVSRSSNLEGPSEFSTTRMAVEKASGESGNGQGDPEVTKITFQVNHPPSRPQRGEPEEIGIGTEMSRGDLA